MTYAPQKNNGRQNVALLGAGYISEWHAKAIRALPNLNLSAVCDKSAARAESTARAFSIPRLFDSLDQLASDPDVDSVHVLLPPDLHFDATTSLLEHGKNVFIEKPMCLDEAECRELCQLADKLKLRVGVNHNFLFHKAYEPLRRDVLSGRLGWITHINIKWHKELPQLRFGPFGIWMLLQSDNVLHEIGSHAFAYINDLVGQEGQISVETSNAKTLSSGVSIPRNWEIRLTNDGQISAISLALGPGFSEHSVHVRGTLGSATADIERNTYVFRCHGSLPDDFDRYSIVRNEAAALRSYAFRDLRDYILSKATKRIPGNAYGQSIQAAIDAFYSPNVDDRVCGSFGEKVIELCQRARQVASAQLIGKGSSGGDGGRIQLPQHLSAITPTDMQPKVLVLGATGFIGQELCRQLISAGQKVRVLVRDPGKLSPDLLTDRLQVMRGDLSSEADIANAIRGVDYVYHLARAMVKTWDQYEKQDIQVTKNIAQQCIDANVKLLIYTGTIDSYYAGGKAGRIDESTPYDPKIKGRNLYARCKAASEDLLLEMHRQHNLPVAIFRPGIVIGMGGSPFHWGIGMWHFDSVCEVWGSGKNKLPLVLVEDVASGLVKAIETDGIVGKSFNLIGDPVLSAEEYLDALEECAGFKLQRHYVRPWRFYAFDMFKWITKCIVRHPERRMPTYRDWESRTQLAQFDCDWTKKQLNWFPTTKRQILIERGIRVPVEEIRRG